MAFKDKYGPWALIPGGSEGVGAAFARKLGRQGLNLVLLARKPGPLEEVAAEVRAESGVEVRTLAMDLTAPDMLERIRAVTDDIEVGLVVYNAGAAHRIRPLHDGSLEDALAMIRLNAVGQTTLAYHFGGLMKRRGRGGFILVGSMAGNAGGHAIAVYSAAKAYTQTFAEALWAELKPHGVDVLGLVLGATRTPAMARAGMNLDHPDFRGADPDDMAQQGLDHLAEGPIWVPPHLQEGFRHLRGLPRDQAAEWMSQGTRAIKADA
jgi:short-subunit dehydrogenase